MNVSSLYRYKEGRVILEHALITESEGIVPRPANFAVDLNWTELTRTLILILNTYIFNHIFINIYKKNPSVLQFISTNTT